MHISPMALEDDFSPSNCFFWSQAVLDAEYAEARARATLNAPK